MFTGKADHAYKMQLTPLGVFVRNAVEELKETKKSFLLMRLTPPCVPLVVNCSHCMAGIIYGSIDGLHIYPAQVQTRAEGPDDVVGEIRLLGIPHEPNGDDLRTVEEHPADLNALATVALQDRGRRKRRKRPFQS